eukprot:364903-Chlamydomonas_euryale.AAC.7
MGSTGRVKVDGCMVRGGVGGCEEVWGGVVWCWHVWESVRWGEVRERSRVAGRTGRMGMDRC